MVTVALSLDEELEFVELAERMLEKSREWHRRLLLLSFLLLGAGAALLAAVFRFHWSSFFAFIGYAVVISGVILNAAEIAQRRGASLADRLIRDGFRKRAPDR